MEKKKIHQDVFIGIACMVLTGFVFLINAKVPSDVAAMPRLLASLMAILSVILFVQGIKKSGSEEKPFLTVDILKVPCITWIIVVAYVVLFKLCGYFIATPIMLIVLMRFMKQTSWKVIIAIIVVYLLIIYIFFVKQMGVSIGNFGLLGKLF